MTRVTDRAPKPPLWMINQMTVAECATLFAGVFENTTWVVAKASLERPFASKQALLATFAKAVATAPEEDQLALLRAHPMLGVSDARREALTEASRDEQAAIGLDRMGEDEEQAFARLNLAYQRRFGFPFIIAVKGQRDRAAILAALGRRLEAAPEAERQAALAEVLKIAGFRIEALIDDDARVGTGHGGEREQ